MTTQATTSNELLANDITEVEDLRRRSVIASGEGDRGLMARYRIGWLHPDCFTSEVHSDASLALEMIFQTVREHVSIDAHPSIDLAFLKTYRALKMLELRCADPTDDI